MPRPEGGYRLKTGERVPGVTTICAMMGGGKTRGLMHWAWKLGSEGKDYRETSEDAMTVGSVVHEAVTHDLNGGRLDSVLEVVDDDNLRGQAEVSCYAYLEWRESTNLEVTETEVSMVSEEHQYGGTIDWATLLNDRRAILDVKSSSGVYSDYLIQLAAYGHLWNETHPDDPVTGGYYLLRIDKENGGFDYRWWPELNDAWEAFRHLRSLYALDKAIKC